VIDAVLGLVLIILVSLFIVLPVYINLFRESIWEYVSQRLEEQQKHEQLKRNMKQRKKGNQNKSILR
jgi:hypothetical protein